MGMGCGWQCRQDFAHLVTLFARPRQTNLEDTRRQEASLQRWEILCKCKKMYYRNFAGTMDEKLPGKYCQQALSACLLESKFEG